MCVNTLSQLNCCQIAPGGLCLKAMCVFTSPITGVHRSLTCVDGNSQHQTAACFLHTCSTHMHQTTQAWSYPFCNAPALLFCRPGHRCLFLHPRYCPHRCTPVPVQSAAAVAAARVSSDMAEAERLRSHCTELRDRCESLEAERARLGQVRTTSHAHVRPGKGMGQAGGEHMTREVWAAAHARVGSGKKWSAYSQGRHLVIA